MNEAAAIVQLRAALAEVQALVKEAIPILLFNNRVFGSRESLFLADKMNSTSPARNKLLSATEQLAATVARNFCPTCGKPTPPGSIHTCTPPIHLTAPTAQER